MNTKTIALLSAIAFCTVSQAQAPNPRQPNQPPAPEQRRMGGPGMMGGAGMPGMRSEALEEISVPFLGIETSFADAALRTQAKLPGQAGLIVNFVAADSPAKAAGVAQYDVLTKVNDQVLYNPPQLQSLIRSLKPGDDVKLTVIREGETKVLTAKLTEHKVEVPVGDGRPGMPMGGMGPGGMMGGGMAGRSAIQSLSIADGDTKLEVKVANGEVTLTATNKAGETIYSGPIDTREQRAKVPDNVHTLLNDLAVDDLIQRMKAGPQRPRLPDGRGHGPMGGGMGGPPMRQDHRPGPGQPGDLPEGDRPQPGGPDNPPPNP